MIYRGYTATEGVDGSKCADHSNWMKSSARDVLYGHTYSKSMDQPGTVAIPARGQLNRQN